MSNQGLGRGKPRGGYRQDFAACLALLSSTAFEHLDLNRLFAETYDIRPLHISVLEACGFRREGVMQEHVEIDGQSVDSLLHGLLASDWRNRTSR